MAFVISDDNMLDSNNYDQIVIRDVDKETDSIDVVVKGREYRTPMVLLKNRFSDTLKNLSAQECVIKTVDYFLNYSNVRSIIGRPMYDTDFIVGGSRVLDYNVGDLNLALEVESMVWKRYLLCRTKFLEGLNEVKCYSFTAKQDKSNYLSEDGIASFHLAVFGDGLETCESKFLEDFLLSKFSLQDEEAEICGGFIFDEETMEFLDSNNRIVCGDLEFRFQDMQLFGMAKTIAAKYNANREKGKLKQIKMEGF